MFKLNYVKPENAEGDVAKVYGIFPEGIPVPDPLQLCSVSPTILGHQGNMIRYYMTHPKLESGMMAMLRFYLASEDCFDYCVGFNSQLLKMAGGLTDDQLKDLQEDPAKAPLEDEQKALFLFAVRVAKEPGTVTQAQVDELRAMGWTDQDIFDICAHAVNFLASSKLFRAFSK